MAAKPTSCFTFLKEALILPTLNPKLFTPLLLLFAAAAFLDHIVGFVFVQPLADVVASHVSEVNNTDFSSAEYAEVMEMGRPLLQDGMKLILIAVSKVMVALAVGFAKKILFLFAASTTYSGDRYSLAELLRELVKGRISLKAPFITIAVVGALDFAWAVLAALPPALMRGPSGVLSVQGLVSLMALLASLYVTVVALVGVAASVVDRRCRGVRALRQAWRLVTLLRRKEGLLLVLVAHFMPTVVAPLYRVALVYAKTSMALCLCSLAVHAFLSCALQLFSLMAATVYYYQAMQSKEVIDALWLC
ncbi:hypothetical protein CFC21_019299 [Triticum aestivum]|uniref:Uncharacterized protein n=3 Tax=Triticum TaxID=4564 RepID=A0A9R1RDG5_TRITD|nr:uncharacterized protein LOC123190630 [Triticum aestivum]KAF7004045.1 hypothetical protein CFC21_019299 [Triticum aestivum]VAH37313.1 unnamed protein product [Triticum turgidum subsp. durum]